MEDLNSILGSEQAGTPTSTAAAAPATSEATEPTTTEAAAADGGQAQATGDKTAPPAGKQQDDLDKHSSGLKAAAVAERTRRQQAEQRATAAEAQLRTLMEQRQQPKEQQGQQPAGDQEPQREKFANDVEYIRALARFEAKGLRDAERAEERREAAEREASEHATTMQRTADEIVTKGQQQYADFDDVINGSLAPYLDQNRALQHTLLLSERGHEVAYWLGKNPAEAQRVAAMSPLLLARELALIETRLDAPVTTSKEVRPAPVLPNTLTNERDSRGRFMPAYQGPTPLNAILSA